MSASSGIFTAVDDRRLRFELAGRGTPTRPSTSTLSTRPTTNWLAVRRWLMFACTERDEQPGAAGHERARPTSSPSGHADGRRERSAEHHRLERDVDRAGLLGDELPERREQRARRRRSSRCGRRSRSWRCRRARERKSLIAQTLALVADNARRRCADEQERRGQQQREDEQALHDVGDAPGRRLSPAGTPTRCAGSRTRRRRRSARATRCLATRAASRPANPIPAPKLATQLVVAEVASGQHDAAGQTGEPAGHEHRADAVTALRHAGPAGGAWVAAEHAQPEADDRTTEDDRHDERQRQRRAAR